MPRQALTALDPPKSRLRRPARGLQAAPGGPGRHRPLQHRRRPDHPAAGRRGSGDPASCESRSTCAAPYGLAALACIITATPGTLWVEYDSADNTMLLHVLDLIDEEEWVRIIKDRYETRLMEIFE